MVEGQGTETEGAAMRGKWNGRAGVEQKARGGTRRRGTAAPRWRAVRHEGCCAGRGARRRRGSARCMARGGAHLHHSHDARGRGRLASIVTVL